MSGIVGILDTEGAILDRSRLAGLAEQMAFRGPDAQEIWADGPIGLAHTLLRTTHESERERQPCTFDGKIWITADARVDARRELIKKIRAQGRHPGADAPDVELILHAYHVWREECVDHLIGDFAFILWDGERRLLFCARDQYGVKQLYYAQTPRALILSNTLDCIRRHPAVPTAFNERAIADFLLSDFNHQTATTTFFQGIHPLPPAHKLTFQNGSLRVRRYWRLPEPRELRYARAEEYVEQFRELLATVVKERLRAPRVGVVLSGGLDSSTLLALAHHVRLKASRPFDLLAFTTDLGPQVADTDPYYARLLADTFGVPLHLSRLENYQLYQEWDKPTRRLPVPMNGTFNVQQVELMRAMAGSARVALNGQLGDSMLFPWRGYLLRLLGAFSWGRFAREVGTYTLSHGRLPPLYLRTALRERFGHVDGAIEYPAWLNPAFEKRLDLQACWEEHRPEHEPLSTTPMQRYEDAMYGHRLTYHLLFDADYTGVPLESRSPFADVRVANFVLAIPPLPWRINKELLRRAMPGLMPDAVRLRPKTLVRDPIRALFTRSDRRWLNVLETVPQLAEYVDIGKAREILTRPELLERVKLAPNLRPISLAFWLQNNAG